MAGELVLKVQIVNIHLARPWSQDKIHIVIMIILIATMIMANTAQMGNVLLGICLFGMTQVMEILLRSAEIVIQESITQIGIQTGIALPVMLESTALHMVQ